jgi:oligopeptide transport system permease protein
MPILLVISFLAFMLVRVAPGGPFDKERNPASPEIERQIKAKFHLDEPKWKQYVRFLGDLTHGDLGPSLKYRNHTVNDLIAQGLPVSMTLGGMAFCFALGVGIPIGFFTAVRRGQWPDYAGSFFAIEWRLLPVALWGSPLHTILPVTALGLYFSGRIARLMREGMLNTMQAEFITTARAKGLSENAVLLKHAFRLAVLPVVSYSGPLLADLLTGSFVIENIFQIPGIGVFLVNGSLNRDYPLVVGLVLLYAILLLGLNLLVDLAYSLLDRRVQFE